MSYNGMVYYYLTDIQGNVNGLIDTDGTIVAEYAYDVWGKIISETANTTYSEVMNANPLRYRGYIYDSDTGLYYLQSRYYDPIVSSFINGKIKVVNQLQAASNYNEKFNSTRSI